MQVKIAKVWNGSEWVSVAPQDKGASTFENNLSKVRDYVLEEIFTQSGTWTPIDGITEVQVECWGGGGGGGGMSGSPRGASGGGGGAYARKKITVIPGNTYTYTVGAAGTAGGASNGNGGNGGDTYWHDGLEVKAAGGKGGQGNHTSAGGLGGSTDDSLGSVKYSGGKGGNASTIPDGSDGTAGTGGGGAGSIQNGSNGVNGTSNGIQLGGSGGIQHGGKGGDNTGSNVQGGNPGSNYGGGGSGARRITGSHAGGAGAPGLIRIRYEVVEWMEPEVLTTIQRMTTKPSPSDLKDYDDLIKSVKTGQGLALGVDNLSTKLKAFYINAAHDKEAQKLNWSQNLHDKTEVGTTIFTAYRGIKSNGSSYNNLNLVPTDTSRKTLGGYLVEDVDAAVFAMGRKDSSNRGIWLQFNTTNAARGERNLQVSGGPSGIKRHNCVRRLLDGVTIELWVNGVLVDTDTPDTNINYAWGLTELAANENGSIGGYLQSNLAFTYYTQAVELDIPALHTSLKAYLINKGITGL